jgi:hypothetical protein
LAVGAEYGADGGFGPSFGEVIAALTQATLSLHEIHLDDEARSSLANRIDERSISRSYRTSAEVMMESAESLGATGAYQFINRPDGALGEMSPEVAIVFNAGRFAEALTLLGELPAGAVTSVDLRAAISRLCPPPAWPPIC